MPSRVREIDGHRITTVETQERVTEEALDQIARLLLNDILRRRGEVSCQSSAQVATAVNE